MSVLNLPTGAKASAILGIGGYRPRRVVDNAEICTYIDSSDEWIRTRSGIVERRWASPDETVKMMSIEAAKKALERAGRQGRRGVRHLRGLRRLLLHGRDGRLVHPHRCLEAHADHRHRAAVRP